MTLFLVLGSIYVLAVLVLESAIMPLYVYRPLRQMLEADAATQAGDREGELIPGEEILGDEIGQIMRSRNETVAELRRQEDELAAALQRLEEQDRLVSLGLLSASVAHELNTPLAVLNGSIEKLIETTSDPHTLERLAADAASRAAAAADQRKPGRIFERAQSNRWSRWRVRPLIEEAWGLVAIDEKSSGSGIREQRGRGGSRDRQRGPAGSGIRESAAQRAERDRNLVGPDRGALAQTGAGAAG